MNIFASNRHGVEKISFVVAFEGIHGILADMHVYAFDGMEELIAWQKVRKGRAVLPIDVQAHAQAHIVLAPSVDYLEEEGPVTLSRIRTLHAFETECRLDSGLNVHFLPEIPESVWRWWVVHSLWNGMQHSSIDWSPAALIL